MKKTVFFDMHVEMGGRMVPFAGYEMPVEFSGVKNEHVQVRKGVGVFDVSHMGEFRITGKNAASFVQRMTSNDVESLSPGKIQYSCFPNGNGGLVDDLLVYKFEEDDFLLVVNASNIENDWTWLKANEISGATITNESDTTSQLAVQGPDAQKVLQKLTPIDLENVPYYSFITGELAGSENVLISNTGYTGSGGFEIYFNNQSGPNILKGILDAGKEFSIIPAGLASRDTLRLESGFCLYGNELNDHTSPLESGLGWITKFTEGNDFIDRPRLEKQKKEGLVRRLAGFELKERGIPRKDYPVLNEEGEEIGIVSSGTMSPLTGKAIGMAYINLPYNKVNTNIYIGIRNKQIPAAVVRPPFFNKEELR